MELRGVGIRLSTAFAMHHHDESAENWQRQFFAMVSKLIGPADGISIRRAWPRGSLQPGLVYFASATALM